MAKLSLIVLLTTLITQLHQVQGTHHPLCKKHPSSDFGILYSNACYYVYATPRNNSDAFAVCEDAHTNLVFFPKVVPHLQIMDILKAENISKIWLGLKQSTPTKWAWKYKEDFYPLVGVRWEPESPVSATLEGATTSVNATWTRANVNENYSFVCEDPTPLDLYSVGCADDSLATLVLYHPTLMQCYYLYSHMFNYTRGRDLCHLRGRHVLHLETQAEITTFVNEMSGNVY
ncbi:lymphocyte antigen 75-like [Haliotis rubra]|uniref:lymphocyte antigen 75-like n=1 Tax=Haliotis rubra TaxID=36100 RepID=UPI001EE5C5A1|nr:lymphocyte antigen 75-like [Haliotis rubra]